MLGGGINVHSQPGKGSSFGLTIDPGSLDGTPMLDNPAEAALQSRPLPADPKRNRPPLNCRVLLVEDGYDNQRLIALLLRKAGAEVVVVENGQVAIEAVVGPASAGDENKPRSFQPFDVILMDMQMPVLDGYEATRQLRAMGYTRPIVALTAHAMSQDRQQCLDAGCDDYLAKPIERQALLDAVARHPPHGGAADHAQPSAASASCNSSG